MSIVIHTIKGNGYAYEHHRDGNKVVCDYLGRYGGKGEINKGTQEYDPEVTQQDIDTQRINTNSAYKEVDVKNMNTDPQENTWRKEWINDATKRIELSKAPDVETYSKELYDKYQPKSRDDLYSGELGKILEKNDAAMKAVRRILREHS